jgi:hypothetical protein
VIFPPQKRTLTSIPLNAKQLTAAKASGLRKENSNTIRKFTKGQENTYARHVDTKVITRSNTGDMLGATSRKKTRKKRSSPVPSVVIRYTANTTSIAT